MVDKGSQGNQRHTVRTSVRSGLILVEDGVERKEPWDNDQRGPESFPRMHSSFVEAELRLIFFLSWFGSPGASTKQTQETGRVQICMATDTREKGYGNGFFLLQPVPSYCPP